MRLSPRDLAGTPGNRPKASRHGSNTGDRGVRHSSAMTKPCSSQPPRPGVWRRRENGQGHLLSLLQGHWN